MICLPAVVRQSDRHHHRQRRRRILLPAGRAPKPPHRAKPSPEQWQRPLTPSLLQALPVLLSVPVPVPVPVPVLVLVPVRLLVQLPLLPTRSAELPTTDVLPP